MTEADPPPVLHRYRRPTGRTLEELAAPEIYIAGVEDMNDPLEFLAPSVIDQEKLADRMYKYARTQLQLDHEGALVEANRIDESSVKLLRNGMEELRRNTGLICASANPRSNKMWAYYAEAHKGICIGYTSTFSPFIMAKSVKYKNPKSPFNLLDILRNDPTLLKEVLSCRKGSEWAFEEEYRIPIGPMPPNKTRLLPISQEAIIEIRFGVNVEKKFRDKVIQTVRAYDRPPDIFQMKVNPTNFSIDDHELCYP